MALFHMKLQYELSLLQHQQKTYETALVTQDIVSVKVLSQDDIMGVPVGVGS